MPRRRLPPGTLEKYLHLRGDLNIGRVEAAHMCDIHPQTARAWDKKHNMGVYVPVKAVWPPVSQVRNSTVPDNAAAASMAQVPVPEPIPHHLLGPEASRALEDIAYFAERYFGAILMPFHTLAVEKITELLATPWEEYLITNIAPGAGKSMFKRVVGAWLTCHDRTFRGLMGSSSRSLAVKDTDALRSAFERTSPAQASGPAKKAGFALDAVATLAGDFGRFKPNSDDPNIWRADGFRVAQIGGLAVSDKELTWLAVGWDTKYIGTRVNGAFWDDPHDGADIRTLEAREKMIETWQDVAEARLETGGLLWLIQQRLGQGDLTAHALSQTVAYDLADGSPGEERPVYRQIRFRAHYEDRCVGDHGPDAKPWPTGCLLFPRKLHWRLLQAKMRLPNFAVVYQQEEVSPTDVLVPKLWVYGGTDPVTREMHPGCVDADRKAGELPDDLRAPFYSIATVDPSPSNFWAIQWWIYEPATERRFLIDLVRQRMGANQWLTRRQGDEFAGIAEDWQVRSVELGAPIGWWVIEQNAAQKFMVQADHVNDWKRRRGVVVIGHDTGRNKADPKYGVNTIGVHWQMGRVRLPWHPASRLAALKLIDEVTAYPKGTYDDCVMAEWFFEWNLRNLARPRAVKAITRRPDYIKGLPRTRVAV